ncbi:MAG TPA: TIGR01459 family HAD-type hydrolase [Sphingomicrobium sp.]|jgi:HAD superfamily hydrolase (TIGR01459 family)|nr:TIGR01459 family HAD-type hydrolase [Sphingomicrobium sp.]
MSALDEIDDRYAVILCDIWGCIHDGVELYAGVTERLQRWRESSATVILITNAPRTAEAVAGQLFALGLDESLWSGIATSGDAGIECLKEVERPVGFIGTVADRAILESRGVSIADGGDFDQLACSGLDEKRRTVADYDDQIRPLASRDVLMHCLNPDRFVIRGGVPEPCAGAIADRYIELGGRVEYYGKPFPAIYRHAMRLAGDPAPGAVLAIGDGLDTDVLGAARMGFDCVYVSGGISQGEGIPDDFAAKNHLGGWRPVAVVEGLA